MVTHQDIAKLVGVSQATVSKVLSNKSNNIGISATTRAAVIEAAKSLGYNRDKVAASLIQLVEKTIAILVEHIANPFNSVIMNGIEQELAESEYHFLFASSNGRPEVSLKTIELLTRRYITGFILMPFYESNTSQQVQHYLKMRGVPFVQTNYHILPEDKDVRVVGTNNYDIFAQLTQHLINLGHQRIALVYTSPEYSSMADRLRAFQFTMEQAGLKVPASMLIELPRADYFDLDTKKQLLKRWLGMKNPPTAIMCVKDASALQFIRLIETMGLSVPDDIAVTGFDDYYHYLPKYYHETYHRLTTVRQNLPEIGKQSARLLIKMIESPQHDKTKSGLIVPGELIVRGSCGAKLGRVEEDISLRGLGSGFLVH